MYISFLRKIKTKKNVSKNKNIKTRNLNENDYMYVCNKHINIVRMFKKGTSMYISVIYYNAMFSHLLNYILFFFIMLINFPTDLKRKIFPHVQYGVCAHIFYKYKCLLDLLFLV